MGKDRLDKKIQLEILDEVYEKSFGGKPVEIDTSGRWRNFNFLRDKEKCFVYTSRVEQETTHLPDGRKVEYGSVEIPQYLSGLSKEGKEYRDVLAIEVKEEQRKDKQIEFLGQQVIAAKVALIFSGIATLIALGSLAVAYLAYIK